MSDVTSAGYAVSFKGMSLNELHTNIHCVSENRSLTFLAVT